MSSNAELLGQSIADFGPTHVTEELKAVAKCHLADAFATVAASQGVAGGDIPASVSADFGGGPSTVLFANHTAAPSVAAFVNAQRSIANDFGSNLFFSQGLPGLTIFSALAVAEQVQASGAELLTAVVAGFETAARVALSLPPPYTPDPHGTGIVSQSMPRTRWITFGAAGSVARLLGLSGEQAAHALALTAATAPMPPGPRLFKGETDAMAKYGMNGSMAFTAVMAGHMARMGFTGDLSVLDAAGSFHAGLGVELYDAGTFSEPFGEPWYMTHAGFKRYPSGTFNQQAVHGVKLLVKKHGLKADEIDSITIGKAIGLERLFTHKHPSNYVSAQFSLPFAVAMVCLGIPTSEWSRHIDDERAHALADRVELYEDAEAVEFVRQQSELRPLRNPWLLEAKIHIRAGATELEEWSDYGRVGWHEITEKWRTWNPHPDLDDVLGLVDTLEDLDDVRPLTQLLRRDPRG